MEQSVRIGVVAAICGFIVAIVSGISTFLTGLFMWNLGGNDTLLTVVLTSFGVCLDVFKHILPVVIMFTLAKKSYAFGISLSVCFLLLSGFSYLSSMAAIEDRVNESIVASRTKQIAQEEIEILKKELSVQEVLFYEQKAANQVTKMDNTTHNISEISNRIVALNSTQANEDDTVLVSNKKLVVYMGAGLIEVLSLLAMICVVKLDMKPNKEDDQIGDKIERLLAGIEKREDEKPNLQPQLKTEVSVDKTSETIFADNPLKEESTPLETTDNNSELKDTTKLKKEPVLQATVKEIVSKGTMQNHVAAEQPEKKDVDSGISGFINDTKNTISENPFTNIHDIDNVIENLKNGKLKPNFRDLQGNYGAKRNEVTACLHMLKEKGTIVRGKGNRYYLA